MTYNDEEAIRAELRALTEQTKRLRQELRDLPSRDMTRALLQSAGVVHDDGGSHLLDIKAYLDLVGARAQVDVAWVGVRPRVDDADDRFAREIRPVVPDLQ